MDRVLEKKARANAQRDSAAAENKTKAERNVQGMHRNREILALQARGGLANEEAAPEKCGQGRR
jgi:hypothetical protein